MTPSHSVKEAFSLEEGNEYGSQGTTDTSYDIQVDMQGILTYAAKFDPSWQSIDLIESILHRLRDLGLKEASISMQLHSKPHISDSIVYTCTLKTIVWPYTS